MTTMQSYDGSARSTPPATRATSTYVSAGSLHQPATSSAASRHQAVIRPESSAPSSARPDAARRGPRSALVLLAFIGITVMIAALGSLVSAPVIDGWYAETPKPMWNPPNAVFGPVWTVLYVLMSVAAWLVWRRPDSELRSRALRLYVAQLALNALWSPAFFGLGALFGAPGVWVALGIIVALDFAILATIIRFGDISRVAAGLLVPYWLWALFATTLNAAIAVLAR